MFPSQGLPAGGHDMYTAVLPKWHRKLHGLTCTLVITQPSQEAHGFIPRGETLGQSHHAACGPGRRVQAYTHTNGGQ